MAKANAVPHRGRGLALAVAGLVAAALWGSNCVSSSERTTALERAGSVDLALSLSPVATVASVAYQITGNGITPISGSIDVSDPSATISILLSGIPVGTGYLVTLSATSTDGRTTCLGSATFDIVANQTSAATVTLTCTTRDDTGTVIVNGTINNCPVITSLTVSPVSAPLGGLINLQSAAIDADVGTALTFAWTATAGGSFANASASNTTYTCTPAGSHLLRLTVTDGQCPKFLEVAVSCGSGGPGIGGVSGTGGTPPGTGGISGTGGTPPGTGGISGTGGTPPGTGGTSGAGIPVWPGNATQMVAEDHGGGINPMIPPGSTCMDSGKGVFTLVMATKQLTWHVCRRVDETSSSSPFQIFDGSRTLTTTQFNRVITALQGVVTTSKTDCGSGRPTLTLTATTPPAVTTSFLDSFYACQAASMGMTAVDMIEPVFVLVRLFGR